MLIQQILIIVYQEILWYKPRVQDQYLDLEAGAVLQKPS